MMFCGNVLAAHFRATSSYSYASLHAQTRTVLLTSTNCRDILALKNGLISTLIHNCVNGYIRSLG